MVFGGSFGFHHQKMVAIRTLGAECDQQLKRNHRVMGHWNESFRGPVQDPPQQVNLGGNEGDVCAHSLLGWDGESVCWCLSLVCSQRPSRCAIAHVVNLRSWYNNSLKSQSVWHCFGLLPVPDRFSNIPSWWGSSCKVTKHALWPAKWMCDAHSNVKEMYVFCCGDTCSRVLKQSKFWTSQTRPDQHQTASWWC